MQIDFNSGQPEKFSPMIGNFESDSNATDERNANLLKQPLGQHSTHDRMQMDFRAIQNEK
jgi:hypothetical protein